MGNKGVTRVVRKRREFDRVLGLLALSKLRGAKLGSVRVVYRPRRRRR